MLPIAFFPDRSRCHGNEIWNKIGYNSACVRDICEIFVSMRGFGEWASECCQSNFTPTDPRCNGNEMWDKMGYNSTYVRDISKIHSQCDADNITFCDFCYFRCASSSMLPLTSAQTDVLYILTIIHSFNVCQFILQYFFTFFWN